MDYDKKHEILAYPHLLAESDSSALQLSIITKQGCDQRLQRF